MEYKKWISNECIYKNKNRVTDVKNKIMIMAEEKVHGG